MRFLLFSAESVDKGSLRLDLDSHRRPVVGPEESDRQTE